MKVPPLQNLIVRAIPAQNIVRHIVLAAAAHVLGLCGAARAQSVPAAPALSLWNAVEITHATVPDSVVTLERSKDLQLWSAVGTPVFGDGDEITQLISAGSDAEGFFRLKTEVRPGTGKGRWDLTGTRLLLNTSRDVRSLAFGPNGAGTATLPDNQMSFTWQWERTGEDAGRLILTWPDGLVETMSFEFTAANAGAFTCEKTRNGSPAGAVRGVFRDEASTELTAGALVEPGDATLVISGTGRPVSVSLSATGEAHISSPSGGSDYSVSYSLSGGTTAHVLLSCATGQEEFYALEFTGPSCGVCQTTSRLNNRLRRSSAGTFTIAPR